MMRSNIDIKSKVALKFVMSKLKRLVTDNTGNLSYMENLDDILKDIFGTKNFTKKLDRCYDDRESVMVINEIGMKNLMTICNTQRIYTVFSELIVMNSEIHRIYKILRKMKKKGKHKDKRLEKEYNYLLDTYRKAIKTLAKSFGISKKSSYKKKFRSVNDLLDSKRGFSYYDDDDSISSVLYDDDDDFYDDDDDDGLSEFERYFHRVAESSGKRNKKKVGPSILSDEDDDDDCECDDEDDEDDDIEELKLKVNDMNNKMSTLTSTLQALINSNVSTSQPRQAKQPQNDNNSGMYDIGELTKSIMYLAKCQKDSIERQDFLLDQLQALASDELPDEDNEDGIMAVVQEGERINSNQSANVIDPRGLSMDQLIDVVNSEKPANLEKPNSQYPREPRPGSYQ